MEVVSGRVGVGGEGGGEEERRHSAMVWGWLKLGLACVGVVGGIWGRGC